MTGVIYLLPDNPRWPSGDCRTDRTGTRTSRPARRSQTKWRSWNVLISDTFRSWKILHGSLNRSPPLRLAIRKRALRLPALEGATCMQSEKVTVERLNAIGEGHLP